MNGHYAESVLHDYHDGMLSSAEQAAVLAHVQECQMCASLDQRVMAFDRALRMVPLEHPGPAFTTRVVARLGQRGQVSWLDRVLDPRIIAGTTLVLFGAAGTVNALLLSIPGHAGAWGGSLWEVALDRVTRGVTAGPDALAAWLRAFLPQVFSHGALQVSLAVVLLVPLFLWADRIMERRRVIG